MNTERTNTTGSSRSSVSGWHAAARYSFDELWTPGRTGSLYKALDRTTGESAFLKLLPFRLNDVQLKQQFEDKARRLSGIALPHCVETIGFGYHFGLGYIVSRYVEGSSLSDYLAIRGPLDFALFGAVFHALLEAIEGSEKHSLIHGDVQASHIILEDYGGVLSGIRLLGFGFPELGEGQSRDARHEPESFEIAPERILGAPVDHRLDLFGLGVTAYHVLSGRHPFQGHIPFGRVLESVVPLREVLPSNHEVPKDVIELVEDLMRSSPADRPGSATEVRARFESAYRLESDDIYRLGRACLSQSERAVCQRIRSSESSRTDGESGGNAATVVRHNFGVDAKPGVVHSLSTEAPVPGWANSGAGAERAQKRTWIYRIGAAGLVIVGFFMIAFVAAGTNLIPVESEDLSISSDTDAPLVSADHREGSSDFETQWVEIDDALKRHELDRADSLVESMVAQRGLSEAELDLLAQRGLEIEVLGKLREAASLEGRGELGQAWMLYLDISKDFPEHPELPAPFRANLDDVFVLEVKASTRSVVSVDGEPVGVTPYVGLLPATSSEVVVTREGFEAWSTNVSVQAQTKLSLYAELE